MTAQNSESYRLHSRRIIPNTYLVWLDDYHGSIAQLQQVVDTVETFVNIDECLDFITDQPDDIGFMITSKRYAQQLLPIINDVPQIKSVYILSSSMTGTQQYFKINDGFTDIKSICEALKQALKDDDHNAASISFAKPIRGTSDTKKDTLHCSFMYTQILKEILLTIDFNSKHFNDFLTFCRCEFAGNDRHLRNIDKIQNEYYNRTPIWWYTYESFLYSMINTALRHMDIGIIVKMGFFVRDLHQHIAVLHAEQFNELTTSDTFTVYRGQYLSEEDFIQMKVNTNGLLAFNNFISASKKTERFLEIYSSKSR